MTFVRLVRPALVSRFPFESNIRLGIRLAKFWVMIHHSHKPVVNNKQRAKTLNSKKMVEAMMVGHSSTTMYLRSGSVTTGKKKTKEITPLAKTDLNNLMTFPPDSVPKDFLFPMNAIPTEFQSFHLAQNSQRLNGNLMVKAEHAIQSIRSIFHATTGMQPAAPALHAPRPVLPEIVLPKVQMVHGTRSPPVILPRPASSKPDNAQMKDELNFLRNKKIKQFIQSKKNIRLE
jgi:hypothetical protein